MGASFFQFKQFIIRQGNCGMKVSMDACLFGALVNFSPQTSSILDVGCGTGLLSFMMAQRYEKAQVTGVEISVEAWQQAIENVSENPWSNRISFIQGDIRQLNFDRNFDAIIVNPPFYENQLPAINQARKMARHDETLNKKELVAIWQNNLAADGVGAILLPPGEHRIFQKEAEEGGLFGKEFWHIKTTKNKPVKRIVSLWQKSQSIAVTNHELQVYENQLTLTSATRELLHPFYLRL